MFLIRIKVVVKTFKFKIFTTTFVLHSKILLNKLNIVFTKK